VQLSRAKEQLEKLTDDRERKDGVDQRSQDESKRHQRQLRELQEQFAELQRKESEASARKNELVRVHVVMCVLFSLQDLDMWNIAEYLAGVQFQMVFLNGRNGFRWC